MYKESLSFKKHHKSHTKLSYYRAKFMELACNLEFYNLA